MNLHIIKQHLEKAGMTARELCQKAEISEQGYYKIMRTNTASIETIEKISRVLEIPIGDFFAEASKMEVTNGHKVTVHGHINHVKTGGDANIELLTKEIEYLKEMMKQKDVEISLKDTIIEMLKKQLDEK
jgi:transcriptional regulator with XRE-family HTH domain